MDPISHRREGNLPWEWLGDNPLNPNNLEFFSETQIILESFFRKTNILSYISFIFYDKYTSFICFGINFSK